MFATLLRRRIAPLVVFVSILAGIVAGPALAQSTAFLNGTVRGVDGKPAAGASVTAIGANATFHAKTDATGTFRFGALPIGSYDIDVLGDEATALLRVDVGTTGTTIAVQLKALKTIGRSSIEYRPPVVGSGTDLTLNSTQIEHSPAAGSLPALLLQLPGAARGANGVVHINGDHGDVNYIVDGVQIPQELNRNIGTEIDPSDISFVNVLEGAYPAQYGERFASVIDVTTRSGAGPAGFSADLNGGSYGLFDGDVTYHTPLGKGNLIVAFRDEASERGLDPPNPQSPHNDFSNSNEFLRYTDPLGKDFLNFTLTHSYQAYQIPNDVGGGEPATTDDNETQDDLFANLQFRHPISDHGSLSFGPSYKRSHIQDFGDPANDYAYGEALNPGNPADCANALSSAGPVVNGIPTNPVANPAVAYSPATCGFSLAANRLAIDYGGVFDYDNRSTNHDVKFGGDFDATHVEKDYAVSLQPGNFLAPIFTPATPGGPYTVADDAPNVGHLAAFYLQDTWKLGNDYELDYGARSDTFSVFSTDFSTGFGQISPRLKVTRFFAAHKASIYAFYGRFFTPFSLEDVSPIAAYTLNLPFQSKVAQFDLKPQRDSDYELGGHLPLGRGDLGLRVMQKDATDLIDDTEVGVTLLHQDINYALGRIATQSAYYQQNFTRSGRFYASLTHTYAVNKGCETQLLAPCFPETVNGSLDWTPADHDQRVDVSSGIVFNDARGGWLGIDGEYGSGLSTGLNPTGGITCAGPGYTENIGGPCKFTPHTTFDAVKGIPISKTANLVFSVDNVLNDEYLVTYLNAQGNHYAEPRTFKIGVQFKSK